MTEDERNILIQIEGVTYDAVLQLAVEEELSIASSLDLLVAKGVKMVNFERVGDDKSTSILNGLSAKLETIEKQIDLALEKLRTSRL